MNGSFADPSKIIDQNGFTVRAKRNFAPNFDWNGFYKLHTSMCPHSRYIHAQDKDTLRLRSALILLAEEILGRFRQGTSVSEFLGNHPNP